MIKIGELLTIDLASILMATASLIGAAAAFVVAVAKHKNRQRNTNTKDAP